MDLMTNEHDRRVIELEDQQKLFKVNNRKQIENIMNRILVGCDKVQHIGNWKITKRKDSATKIFFQRYTKNFPKFDERDFVDARC